MRPSPLSVLMLAVGLAACGSSDAADAPEAGQRPLAAATLPAAPGATVLGTIEATVDGARMELYVVSGDIRGQPYASAGWDEPSEGRLLAAIGGMDTPNPPLETFQVVDPSNISLGDYKGPVLSLALDMPADARPFSVELSSGRLRAEGTFSGTVRSMGSGEAVEITDGRFSVEDVPNMSEITP